MNEPGSMWLLKWIPLFMFGAALESTTQVFLKKGAAVHSGTGGMRYYLKLLRNRWVIAGILIYLLEMVIWIVLLAHIPLSIAFPLTGFQKIFIILLSVILFREKVNRMEWIGVGLTCLGIALIANTA